jgi:glycosyltransferase involved in cell wall biosynthesis
VHFGFGAVDGACAGTRIGMPRTILHLIDTGGPGGAETIFLELVERLNRERWRSIPVVPSQDWLHASLSERGLRPVLLPTRRSFDLGYLTRLLSLAHRHGAALIHTHLLTTAVYGSAVGRLSRIPVVSTFHGNVDIDPTDRFKRVKMRMLERPTNRIVFVSESLRRSVMSAEGLRPKLTRVIPNGIDTSCFRPARDASLREELGVRSDEILVGAVGNVRASKDYANLLRAAAWLRERSPSYRFAIAGDTRSGGLYDELLAMRSQFGLEDAVKFVGFCQDVPRFLNNCDIYVLSSDQEGFSLTTVQSMACGVPVIATRSGGPEEILTDGKDGLLVPASDSVALGRSIEVLASDPARRARLASAGRRTAEERFGVEVMVRAYEDVYQENFDDEGLAAAPRRGHHVGTAASLGLV